MDSAPTGAELTIQERETLKAIAVRHAESAPVRPGSLVTDLCISPATVTARLKRLHDLRMVEHIPYAGVTLTEQGMRVSVQLIRRHRITERFLVDLLGFGWDEAESIAPDFEHTLPDEVVSRLSAHLGEPKVCPHGFPIPRPNDSSLPSLRSLIDLDVGEEGALAVPASTDRAVISYLDELGLAPGVSVRVMEKMPFDGPVTIQIDDRSQTVGNKLARMLSVMAPPA